SGILLESRRHLIERIDENRKLVLRKNIDAVTKISLGDLIGPFSKSLNRDRQTPRNIKRGPRRCENKQKRKYSKREKADLADRKIFVLKLVELRQRIINQLAFAHLRAKIGYDHQLSTIRKIGYGRIKTFAIQKQRFAQVSTANKRQGPFKLFGLIGGKDLTADIKCFIFPG